MACRLRTPLNVLAVDEAMGLGRISTTLKERVELLKAQYSSNDEATRIIPATLTDFYKKMKTDPAASSRRANEIAEAGVAVAAIDNRSFVPDCLGRVHADGPTRVPLPRSVVLIIVFS